MVIDLRRRVHGSFRDVFDVVRNGDILETDVIYKNGEKYHFSSVDSLTNYRVVFVKKDDVLQSFAQVGGRFYSLYSIAQFVRKINHYLRRDGCGFVIGFDELFYLMSDDASDLLVVADLGNGKWEFLLLKNNVIDFRDIVGIGTWQKEPGNWFKKLKVSLHIDCCWFSVVNIDELSLIENFPFY